MKATLKDLGFEKFREELLKGGVLNSSETMRVIGGLEKDSFYYYESLNDKNEIFHLLVDETSIFTPKFEPVLIEVESLGVLKQSWRGEEVELIELLETDELKRPYGRLYTVFVSTVSSSNKRLVNKYYVYDMEDEKPYLEYVKSFTLEGKFQLDKAIKYRGTNLDIEDVVGIVLGNDESKLQFHNMVVVEKETK